MRVPAGTAVLFDRCLWHASSPNYLDQSRKVLFYGYAYRWIRPKCIMDVDDLREKTTPIRRQLLGATGSQDGYYLPSEGDVHRKIVGKSLLGAIDDNGGIDSRPGYCRT